MSDQAELQKLWDATPPGPKPAADLQQAWDAAAPPGVLESGARGLAQGATLGFADELAGGGEALLDKIRGAHEALGELYLKHRDESRKKFDAAKQANPIAFGAGQVAGALAPALATAGGSIPEQLAAGAALGGANVLGESKSLEDPGLLGKTALGVAGGAAGAGLGNLAARGVAPLLRGASGAAGAAGNAANSPVAQKVAEFAEKAVVPAAVIPGGKAVLAPALAAAGGIKATARIAPALAKTLGAVGRAAARNPAALGRYGQILAEASQAGPAALNATHFALAQSDPEYQKKVLEAQAEHGEAPEDE